jgi:hypothetical protein
MSRKNAMEADSPPTRYIPLISQEGQRRLQRGAQKMGNPGTWKQLTDQLMESSPHPVIRLPDAR